MAARIAIVGGGLVGLCAALVLQNPKRKLTVIEAGGFDLQPSQGLSARSIALSASSVQIFRALGLWQQLEPHAEPIQKIHVSARAKWGVTRLQASDYGIEALGYVIENQALEAGLLQAVNECENIELRQQAASSRSNRTNPCTLPIAVRESCAACRRNWR